VGQDSILIFYFNWFFTAFSALTPLAEHQERYLAGEILL